MIVEKKAAGRAVLGSVFFLTAAFFLWCIAVGSYVIFYLSYIPTRGFTLPVYLQFEPGRDLFASVPLPSNRLVSGQPYDVKLHLNMPQTPANIAAGNFMLGLQLLKPVSSSWAKAADGVELVVASRRPAILTYYSPVIQHMHNFVALPLYVLGWRKESETLAVSLMEGVEFGRGWQNIPVEARVELSSLKHLQIYSAKLSFKTRLKGLRYFMYKYRISSFMFFTSLFWGVEIFFSLLAWWLVSAYLPSSPESSDIDDDLAVAKREENGIQGAKKEEDDESRRPLHEYPALEADDEDDDVPSQSLVGTGALRISDSGLGTSLESGASRHDPVRRRSKPVLGGEG